MTNDDLLDAIETAAEDCDRNIHNPRYFARMFASTISFNPTSERIVLEELLEAVQRIALRQGQEGGGRGGVARSAPSRATDCRNIRTTTNVSRTTSESTTNVSRTAASESQTTKSTKDEKTRSRLLDAEARRLYTEALPLLSGPLGEAAGIPTPKPEAGPPQIRAARKALAAHTFETCLAAVEGALRFWAAKGKRGQSFSAIFTTGMGTSDLDSRISFFASQREAAANSGNAHSTAGLDMDNARMAVRNALTWPESDFYRQQADQAEADLDRYGYVVHRGDDGRTFTIERRG